MRNEENPRAGGSETGDACRQKAEAKPELPAGKISGGSFLKKSRHSPQKYL
ncbi:unknown [Bacteroides fragilis CAG:47]|nr:unknown [Bacteroides fragilis CAG:47]